MKDPLFIRALYRPSQPAEDETGKGLLFYKEHAPGKLLQAYIHCFWELRTSEKLPAGYSYRVVSDGCVDLLMDCNDFEGMLIAGIANAAFDIPMQSTPSYFGIRFLPGCVNYFFNFPVGAIADEMIPADTIIRKELSAFASLLFEEPTMAKKIRIAESFLLSRLINNKASLHPRLSAALHHIFSTSGNVPIETGAAEWISPRQLRRLFHQHIGCSPKLFARIVRFQHTLKKIKNEPGNHSFYHDGYYDQAHFIKEFKTFYGETPSAFSYVQ